MKNVISLGRTRSCPSAAGCFDDDDDSNGHDDDGDHNDASDHPHHKKLSVWAREPVHTCLYILLVIFLPYF